MNAESLFSAHWHHVRDVRARLADDVTVSRHVYRKRVSWVLHRRSTSTSHRLDTESFELIDRLDGAISVGDLWEQALEQRDHTAPSQDAWMHLLADLHAADLLIVDSRIPVDKFFERRNTKRTRDWRQRYLNPLYIRFSLFDPDEWLNRLLPLARVLFSRASFALWAVLMVISALVLFTNSERLFEDASNAARLSPYMVVLFLVIYPPLKLLHELGHAMAIKRCGGDVHEMGMALLVMFPLPYVDASASSLFNAKNDRILVSAAGILVELSLAAVGVLLWASSHGFMSDVGLVLLLTGGLSTLLMNANPLLKFDGYYMFADWLETPNLQVRARRAVARTLRGCLSGKPDEKPRLEDPREWRWLVSYGIVSALYRTGLMLWIAWIVSDRWFLFGMALAFFAIFQAVMRPLWRAAQALLHDRQLRGARAKALALGVPTFIVAALCLLPLPHASVTRGVVWLPDEAMIRAAGDCEVNEVMIAPGSDVQAGDVLFLCTDTELQAQEQYLVARVAELEAGLSGVARSDQVEYAKLLPEVHAARTLLVDIRQRVDAQHYRAVVGGRFDVSGTTALLGRAFERGEIAAYTVPATGRTIRLAFAERKIADIDERVELIEVRIQAANSDAEVHTTSIRHRSPRATNHVPSAALSVVGGGPHAADPTGDGLRLLQSIVDIELDWPSAVAPASIGEHVGVRFVHSPKPLAGRLINTVRRAFMGRQSV
jgi:putative peptide zinc metalloprotease protein